MTVVRGPTEMRFRFCPTRSAQNLAFANFCADAFRYAKSMAWRPDSIPVSRGGLQQSPKTPTPQ